MTKMGKMVLLTLIIILAGAGYLIYRPNNNVYISPPNPTPLGNPNSYLAGHISIGPFCPVEQVGHPCPVPPEAYTSREVVVYKNDQLTVQTRVHLDAQGNYKIALAPGNYFVQIVPAGIGAGEKKPASIVPNETTTIDFDIDTGIR